MSRETINEARIWCDGCGLTYLEVLNSVEVDAMQRCGWITRERNGGRQDLCPACRPDSPFEAVERVRDVPASQIVGSDGHVRDMLLRADVLRALEGDSDELASP